MPRSFSSGYQERNRRLQMEAEARNAAAQRTTQAVTTALQKGAEIVNQLGTSIGNQQAAEYMQGLQTEIKKGIDDGSLMSAKDGSPLTTDESIANYDNFIKGYREKNAEPSNPWAKAAINKSIDYMRQGNVEKIITTSIANLENQRQLSLTEYVGGSADGQRAGITSAQLQNPAEWVDSNMSAFNIDASALSGNIASMYSIATGNASEKNIPADVAAKVVSAYGKAISLGYTQYEAEQYAVSNMTAFARESVIQNAVIGFQNNVINGNEEKWRYMDNVSKFLDGIDADNSYGFAGALSSDYRAALKTDINSRIAEYENNYISAQNGMLYDQVIPVFKDIERNGGYVTRDTFYKVQSDLGISINEKFLGKAEQDTLETIFTNNEILKEMESAMPQLETLAADTTLNQKEKEARYTEITESISNEAYNKLQKYEDSTPLQGKYSIATPSQLRTDLRDTFLSIENTSFIETNKDLKDADKNKYDDLIQSYPQLIAQMSIIGSESDVPLTTFDKTKREFFNVWLEKSTDKYKSENISELTFYDSEGNVKDTEQAFSEKLMEDFEKDWEKYVNLCTSLVENYGATKIGESGDTLNSLYEYGMKMIKHERDMAQAGHYIYNSELTPESDKKEVELFNDAVALIASTSPDKLDELWADSQNYKSLLTEEHWKQLQAYCDADFVKEFSDIGIDISEIIRGINPKFASSQYLKNAVTAEIVKGFYGKAIDPKTQSPGLKTQIENYARDYINHYSINEFTTALDDASNKNSGESFSEMYGNDFKSFRKSILTDKNIEKGRGRFFNSAESYVDDFITDANTNEPITLDSILFKTDASGETSGTDKSLMSEDERFLAVAAQLTGLDYRPGENDEQFWREFSSMADNMGNAWVDYVVTSINDICSWADAAVKVPELLGLDTAISYNPEDPRQFIVSSGGNKLIYIEPEFNADTGSLTDVYMIDPDNPASKISVYPVTEGNMERTLSSARKLINWNDKREGETDAAFIRRKEAELNLSARSDPYYNYQITLYNELHNKMPRLVLKPNLLGKLQGGRAKPELYNIAWEY